MIPSVFVLCAAAMILLALALVLVPLLRRPLPPPPVDGRRAGSGRWPAALVTAIGLPLVVVTVYAMVGQPQSLLGSTDPHRGALADPRHSDGAVDLLARRLKADPADGEGWTLLARSYLQLNRIPEALEAYAKATTLVPGNADLWVEYANTTAIANGRRLAGEPERLVQRALQVDPDNLNALAFAGMVAFQAGDAAAALTHWRRMESHLPADSEDRIRLDEMIARAEGRAAGSARSPGEAPLTVGALPTAPAVAGSTHAQSIRGTVTIAADLAGKVAASDTLYVFARAVDGPPMPLAAVRTVAPARSSSRGR